MLNYLNCALNLYVSHIVLNCLNNVTINASQEHEKYSNIFKI